jgi:signal peptidase I
MMRPKLAGFLAILTPGLGHAYLGAYRRTAFVFFIFLVAVGCSVLAILLLPGIVSVGSSLGIQITVLAWMAWDAYKTGSAEAGGSRAKHRWAVIGLTLFTAWVVIFPGMRSTVAGSFVISSGNMEPTLLEGDRVVATVGFLKSTPSRGDIVVFRWPEEGDGLYIARIVGESGDYIAMRDWRLTINGVVSPEPYVEISNLESQSHPWMAWQTAHLPPFIDGEEYQPTNSDWGPIVVPVNSLFVLGDHRDLSLDSRFKGFVNVGDVTGVVRKIYFSWNAQAMGVRWTRIGQAVR